MPRLRFETVRDLLEAFPGAQDDLQIEPCDEPSLEYLTKLAGEIPLTPAISFCAYLLPRREAVWWGCQSVKAISPPRTQEELAAMQAAEAWVAEPEEQRRFHALAVGRQCNYKLPTTWLALAAGWAGNMMPPGSMAGFAPPTPPKPDEPWLPVAPDQTAKAVRTGIVMASAPLQPADRLEILRGCLDQGKRLAGDGGG
jgi:hypothetical protein